MATFTAKMYGQYPLHLARKRADWVSDAHNVSLHTSTYVPDQDAHDFQNDLTGELATGSGYTAGGQVLANRTATYDSATNTTKLDADDSVWSGSTLTWRHAVITCVAPAVAANNPLVCYNSGDVDTVSTGGATTLQYNAAGIATFQAA